MNLVFHCKHLKLTGEITVKEPIIPVTLIGKNGVQLNFTAILDSGSDLVLLPVEVAEALALDFDPSNPETARVYSGETITTAYSNVNIKIQKGREKVTARCQCSIQLEKQKQQEYIVFGSTFFEHFRVFFDYPRNKFEIKTP